MAIHDPNSKIDIWVKKLEELFCTTDDKENRQRILVFGVIVVALIDHFDPNNKIVRKREIYSNKLSEKSKRSIQGKLLNAHLPFLKEKEKYFKKKGT